MKTHFSDDEYAEKGICGIYSEQIEDKWSYVDCKKCLGLKDSFIKQCEIDNKIICEEMGDFVDYMKETGEYK